MIYYGLPLPQVEEITIEEYRNKWHRDISNQAKSEAVEKQWPIAPDTKNMTPIEFTRV